MLKPVKFCIFDRLVEIIELVQILTVTAGEDVLFKIYAVCFEGLFIIVMSMLAIKTRHI